eukprot:COSAG01_NODE_45195_length_411_cov_1.900641_1_plen_42_part_10
MQVQADICRYLPRSNAYKSWKSIELQDCLLQIVDVAPAAAAP